MIDGKIRNVSLQSSSVEKEEVFVVVVRRLRLCGGGRRDNRLKIFSPHYQSMVTRRKTTNKSVVSIFKGRR